MLCITVLTGKQPFEDIDDDDEILREIASPSFVPPISRVSSTTFRDLLPCVLERNPRDRMTPEMALVSLVPMFFLFVSYLSC
jgi:serine/threonine protein kinase